MTSPATDIPIATHDPASLPRLLYVGDVPVESTTAGAALLYRLLQRYPPDRLRVMHINVYGSPPTARLPGVHYEVLGGGWKRLLSSRFAGWYAGWLFDRAPGRARGIARRVRGWDAQAVLTVAHAGGWLTAVAVADRLRLPLHLIVHDEPIATMRLPADKTADAEAKFAEVYRRAASRLVVSPFMGELFEKKYGPPAQVLYPSRAFGGPVFDAPPARLGRPAGPLTFVYAGGIHNQAYGDAVAALADALEPGGHRLLVYSQLSTAGISAHRLDRPHVSVRPIIPFRELIAVMRETADVLYVPMSFDPADRPNTEISFPSKLTDYTAVGLPLLIRSPAYGSAMRWARENPGVAEIVDSPGTGPLAEAVARLAAGSDYRAALAVNALAAGERFFSHAAAERMLFRALVNCDGNHGH